LVSPGWIYETSRTSYDPSPLNKYGFSDLRTSESSPFFAKMLEKMQR